MISVLISTIAVIAADIDDSSLFLLVSDGVLLCIEHCCVLSKVRWHLYLFNTTQ